MNKVKKPMIYQNKKPMKNEGGQFHHSAYDDFYSPESDHDDYDNGDSYYKEEEEKE
jgi:hypothetical protein